MMLRWSKQEAVAEWIQTKCQNLLAMQFVKMQEAEKLVRVDLEIKPLLKVVNAVRKWHSEQEWPGLSQCFESLANVYDKLQNWKVEELELIIKALIK